MKLFFKKVFFIVLVFTAFVFSACNFGESGTTVNYTVAHYLQNLEDDEYTLYETETLKGISGDYSQAKAKNYTGFTALDFNQITVSKDQTVKIKYDRNIITCTLNFNGGKIILENGTEKTSDVITGRYGEKIILPEPVKTGCALKGWFDSDGNEISETFTESGVYNAVFITKSTASYKVHHYYQNIEDDEYTENLSEMEVLEGKSGTKTQAVAKNTEGFNALSFEQKTVAADESTEINIYYNRKLVTFSFNLAGGKGESTVTKKYGTIVTAQIISDPVKENSTFSGWAPELPQNFTENAFFTAQWDIPYYTVKYLFENIADSAYSSDAAYPEEKYFGGVGEVTDVKAKKIPGFIAEPVVQEVIKENNKTEVTVFYKRKIITLYIDLRGGYGTSFIRGKFGEDNAAIREKLAELKIPVRAGYNLDADDIYSYAADLTFSLQADETTPISVKWIGGSPAKYIVTVYKENAEYNKEANRYTVETVFEVPSISDSIIIPVENNNSVIIGGKTIGYEYFVPQYEQGIMVSGDDSTVFNIYFNRKIVNLTYSLNGGNIDGKTNDIIISGKYGAPVEGLPVGVVRKGCDFLSWDKTIVTFPGEDERLTAQWKGKDFTVTFHNGSQTETKSYAYLKVYAVPSVADFSTFTLDGAGISGWKFNNAGNIDLYCGDSFTLPAPENIDLYACYETHYYTVKYYKQNIKDDDYTLDNEIRVYAVPGNKTRIVPPVLQGFDVLAFNQQDVAEDNSTELEIKYNRKSYTLTFNMGRGYYRHYFYSTIYYKIETFTSRYGDEFNLHHGRFFMPGYDSKELQWVKDDGEIFKTFDGSKTDQTLTITLEEDLNLTLKGVNLLTLYVKFNNLNDFAAQYSEPVEFTLKDCENKILDFEDKQIGNNIFAGLYDNSNFTYENIQRIEELTEDYVVGKLNWYDIYDKPDQQNYRTIYLYAKWINKDDIEEVDYISGPGDIALSNGKYIPYVDLEGYEPHYTESQKERMIAVIAYKYNGTWRGMGKNQEFRNRRYECTKDGEMLSNTEQKELDTLITLTGSKTDGLDTDIKNWHKTAKNAISYYTTNYWKEVGSPSAWKTEYQSNWYVPVKTELETIYADGENYKKLYNSYKNIFKSPGSIYTVNLWFNTASSDYGYHYSLLDFNSSNPHFESFPKVSYASGLITFHVFEDNK